VSRRRIVPFAMLSLLLAAPGVAAAQDANSIAANQEVRIQQLEGQNRDLTGQIEQLNYRVQQLSDRLDKLVADVDFRLRAIEGGGAPAGGQQAPGAAPPPPPPQTMQQPPPGENNPVQQGNAAPPPPSAAQPKMLGTMSQSQYDAQAQRLNQNADAAAAARAAGAATPNPPPAAPEQEAGGAPYTLPGATPDEQYQYAFDLLRQTKYDEAEKALHTFVDEYPENPLAGNASYWLGETYFVRQDYNNAALTFAQGFQKYPKSGKAPDTLLKLGISLAALGETADACKALQELSTRFPTASDSIKQRAAKEQSKNGCH
jgi:tol-pal system protein YbgF